MEVGSIESRRLVSANRWRVELKFVIKSTLRSLSAQLEARQTVTLLHAWIIQHVSAPDRWHFSSDVEFVLEHSSFPMPFHRGAEFRWDWFILIGRASVSTRWRRLRWNYVDDVDSHARDIAQGSICWSRKLSVCSYLSRETERSNRDGSRESM